MKTMINILLAVFTISAYAGGSNDHAHDDDQAHAKSPVGQPADSSAATKTINVELLDSMKFAFSPALEIASGDIVRFVVVNTGQIRHEFSIGDSEEQKAHAKMMKKRPGLMHDDANTVTVEAGETKEITWHFEGDETVVFACNIPGHYEAGMHDSVTF